MIDDEHNSFREYLEATLGDLDRQLWGTGFIPPNIKDYFYLKQRAFRDLLETLDAFSTDGGFVLYLDANMQHIEGKLSELGDKIDTRLIAIEKRLQAVEDAIEAGSRGKDG
jgi:hypothetical protein